MQIRVIQHFVVATALVLATITAFTAWPEPTPTRANRGAERTSASGSALQRLGPVHHVGFATHFFAVLTVSDYWPGATSALANSNCPPGPPPNWDVNCDHVDNILDVVLVGMHWQEVDGLNCPAPEDVNCDGVVNILDVVVEGQHWLQMW